MNKYFKILIFLIFSGFSASLSAQILQSPSDFLGYPLGSQFTYYHQVVTYFEYLAQNSPQVSLLEYGRTYEGRPLLLAAVSNEDHINQLEEIRKKNLNAAGLSNEKGTAAQKPIIWYGFNVHGNESVAMEAALATTYALLEADTANWLEDMIVLIDPCINPDGRDRYANWYRQVANRRVTPDRNSYEHNEPWPGGRYNHYLFDLNRDWCWQTQIETQQRIRQYQRWMPHVAVDFHEMGPNSTFFFGPAAKPFHEVITPWQREFQALVGRNNARYFDQNSWLYFTREVYDLLYPSYGDTWPTYNGAIGFTYEQGGGGIAGRSLIIANGDTLTLYDRLAHHFTAGWATLETAHRYRNKLIEEFNNFFEEGRTNPVSNYKSYVIKTDQTPPARLKAFLELLDKQQIHYRYPAYSGTEYPGFSYQKGERERFLLDQEDVVISAYQSRSRLVQVLLEPETFLEDSITYDLTAWALPYVYNLHAYATESQIALQKEKPSIASPEIPTPANRPYAWLVKWEDPAQVNFLSALLDHKIEVRYAEKSFQINQEIYASGTLIITRLDNPGRDFFQVTTDLARDHHCELIAVETGMVEEGKDFGSNDVSFISTPRLAIINGEGVSPTAFGELWHFIEQDLNYPLQVINTSYLSRVDLSGYDVILLASGSYGRFDEILLDFVQNGGKVIAMERAISVFSSNAYEDDKPLTELARALEETSKSEEDSPDIALDDILLEIYGDRERKRLSNSVAGSIYEVTLDETHPLAFGLGEKTFLIKRNNTPYPYLPQNSWNVGTFEGDAHRSGFTGSNLRKDLENTLAMGVENYGDGTIIYFTDSPIIRQFWYTGKLLLGNAIFLVQ